MSKQTNFNASRFTSGSNALVGTLSGALALGIVRTMDARRRHAANSFSMAEWLATVHNLEAHCRRFEAEAAELRQQNDALLAESQSLRAELELARYHRLRAEARATG